MRREIDQKLHAPHPASGIITEINVRRPLLKDFLDEVRDDFRKNKVELIYRTVRLFEQDDESFLALGEAILRVHHFQSAYSSYARRTPPVGRCFPKADRNGGAQGRYLLPDLSSLRFSEADRNLLSRICGIPPIEAEI